MAAQEGPVVFQNSRYAVGGDGVRQGDYTARALSATALQSNYPLEASHPLDAQVPVRRWRLTEDLSGYPRLSSSNVLSEALYNLSLEELRKDTAAGGTFDAGAKWPGVWTRDVSYSILLSLAAIEPETAKASLLHKVRRGRIVQDTGTGGSWPVSTDRLTWGLAAWEIYLATGERAWLEQSYPILRDSVLDDFQVVVDPMTGLARGESSFLDWREQTYPRWMQPVDIYQSQALGTNVVFYRSLRILQAMCGELHERCEQWKAAADRVGTSINGLFWQEEAGFYGQYRYGGVYPSLSPRAEALGEALTILFDLAPPARQDRMLRAQPVMEFGIPTVFPQTPGIPPYHNDSVWPFVQALWTMAAAKRGDETAVLQGIAAMDRAAALFLTNKENFVAGTGTAAGTAVNSDRQLWSVAGNLAMTYRVLFGMGFQLDGLHFAPVVPQALGGTRTLSGFRYRGAVLDIEVRGYGSALAAFAIDGKPGPPTVPATLTGAHKVTIQLADRAAKQVPVHLVQSTFAPDTPAIVVTDGTLQWPAVEGAATYRVYREAVLVREAAETRFRLPTDPGTYQVSAVDARGTASFLSKPMLVGVETAHVPGKRWNGNASACGSGPEDNSRRRHSGDGCEGPIRGDVPLQQRQRTGEHKQPLRREGAVCGWP